MAPIQTQRLLGGRSLKVRLRGHTLAGRRPHVSDIQVELLVIVGIEPCDAHARPDILDAGFRRLIPEVHVVIDPAAIAVQVVPPEVVRDVQVEPAVLIGIAPSAGKAESMVVLVHSQRRGDFQKPPPTLMRKRTFGGPLSAS